MTTADQPDQPGQPSGRLIGYARVSRTDGEPQPQLAALRHAGCDPVFLDWSDGATGERPELVAALEQLAPGDVLVVWQLERLGRSLRHLLELAVQLESRGIGLRSLTEPLDTTGPTGPTGRTVAAVLTALAQFQADLARTRTRAGLAAASSAAGRGRKPVMTPAKLRAAQALLTAAEPPTMAEVAHAIGVGRTTRYRALQNLATLTETTAHNAATAANDVTARLYQRRTPPGAHHRRPPDQHTGIRAQVATTMTASVHEVRHDGSNATLTQVASAERPRQQPQPERLAELQPLGFRVAGRRGGRSSRVVHREFDRRPRVLGHGLPIRAAVGSSPAARDVHVMFEPARLHPVAADARSSTRARSPVTTCARRGPPGPSGATGPRRVQR